MPLATAAMCGCHVSHREVKVRSSGQQRHDDETVDLGTTLSKDISFPLSVHLWCSNPESIKQANMMSVFIF